ncbi:MAG TPA: trypsin-like peptidase domain-containing protein, partial [Planctomycetota bacterium]|nr:trypsin-like peptidase domain-containing protein [Planctomycetota bacterium]
MRTLAAILSLGAILGAPFEAGAEQDQAARLQKKIEECSRGITERFVFFGGGSGVMISEDGYCLTNHHVAGSQNSTKVTLHSGKQYTAKQVCTDALGDLTLFKIDVGDEKFSFIQLGDSDKLEMGQYVIACGNPFGITMRDADLKMYPTITLGIVSAMHRNQQTYFDCIQTDAAVNPGNSGGPLVTLDGKLVGINGRIATRYMNRVNSGVGYAIPSNQIRNFLPGMMSGGEKSKIYHGMVGGLLLAEQNTQGEGAKILGVRTDSTAESAGFRKGDLIIRVNQYPVFNRERYLGAIGTFPEKTEVTIKVKRDDGTADLKVELERYSPMEGLGFGQAPRPAPVRPKGSGYLGAYVEETKDGIKVMDVRPASPADEAGLQVGDVILAVNDRKINS